MNPLLSRSCLRPLPAALLLALVPAVPSARPQGEDEAGPLRFARVTDERASVMNLPSDSGIELLQPARGAVVAVHRELPDWAEVELPGGFAVWVFGKYLQPTSLEGVLEVTRNAVNMRPLPKSDVNSFPLPQRLHAGDRVRRIEQDDETKPLAESWVRIWSPPGVRAYLRTRSLTALTKDEDGAALFAAAAAKGTRPPPVRPSRAEPAATGAPAPRDDDAEPAAGAGGAVLEAREVFERELARPTPDFDAVRAAWNAVLAEAPPGPVADEARHQLELVEFYEKSAQLRADLERARAGGDEAWVRERAAIEARARLKDPFGSAFLSRGVLVRQITTDGTPHYFLRFGGEAVSEIVCPSGRYDLDVFAGHEIGVNGVELAVLDAGADRSTIEVRRIEVLQTR